MFLKLKVTLMRAWFGGVRSVYLTRFGNDHADEAADCGRPGAGAQIDDSRREFTSVCRT